MFDHSMSILSCSYLGITIKSTPSFKSTNGSFGYFLVFHETINVNILKTSPGKGEEEALVLISL